MQAMLTSMRMTTDTYQAVLPEMHAATTSALYPITTYRAAEGQKEDEKKDTETDGRRSDRGPDWAHRAPQGPIGRWLGPEVDQVNEKRSGQGVPGQAFLGSAFGTRTRDLRITMRKALPAPCWTHLALVRPHRAVV